MHKKMISIFWIIVLAMSLYTLHGTNSEAISQKSHAMSPLQQARMHVSINQIICPEGLEIVMKKSDGSPACVKKNNISILIERGWAIHVLPEYTTSGIKNSDIIQGGPIKIREIPLNYFENATGYLAEPIQGSGFPGVILIHEWWGLNDNIKSMARALASHGYIVLAVDLYAGQVATTPDGARQLLLSFDEQKA